MDPEFDRSVRVQQTWDRAFACNIANAREAHSKPLVIGIIGRGTSNSALGHPPRWKTSVSRIQPFCSQRWCSA
ncbi:hypothetical protein N7578_01800 [Agrobacterium tumefaciens]|nr:hypothetical protein [Agrobacterium tumefaciens]MDS7594231.1 hypothetical protein [Agrobacterium tumefaciens]